MWPFLHKRKFEDFGIGKFENVKSEIWDLRFVMLCTYEISRFRLSIPEKLNGGPFWQMGMDGRNSLDELPI